METHFPASTGRRTARILNTTGPGALSGQRLGRFHIYRPIGSGGASTVYQAFDTVDARAIALKVMHPHSDEVARRRFHAETQIASRLQHPNIVQTFQVGSFTDLEVGYIAMELVYGDTLADLLRSANQLNFAEACILLAPIAEALDYAHRENLVHRDVKPSNVLIRPSTVMEAGHILIASLDYPLVPLLSDFGIAWAMDMPEITAEGRTVGSPAYMAPEQCSGAFPVDSRSDIYSLALILYRCIVGRDLFAGTTSEVLYKHVNVEFDPESLDLQQVTLPHQLLELLQACLTKSPRDRLANAGELSGRLLEIGHSTEIGPAVWQSLGDSESNTITMPSVDQTLQEESGRVTIPRELYDRIRGVLRSVWGRPMQAVLLIVLGVVLGTTMRPQLPASPAGQGSTSAVVPADGPDLTEDVRNPENEPELPNIAAAPILPDSPPATPYALVNALEGVNVRAGPGIDFAVIMLMPDERLLTITGVDDAREWWEVDISEHLNRAGMRGWVSGEYVLTRNTEGVQPLDSELAPFGRPSAPDPLNEVAAPFVAAGSGTLCRDFGPDPDFENALRQFEVAKDLGCAAAKAARSAAVMQSFQNGDLVFMLQSRRLYVSLLLGGSSEGRDGGPGTEEEFSQGREWDFVYLSPLDLPTEGAAGDSPAAEEEARELGTFFNQMLDVIDERTASETANLRSRLGAPVGNPQRMEGVVQAFQNGLLLKVIPEEGNALILQLGKLQRIDLQ